MQNDINLISNALKEFEELIEKEIPFTTNVGNLEGSLVKNGTGSQQLDVFDPFTTPTDPLGAGNFWENEGNSNKVCYMIMNNVILDDKQYQDFKSKIINDIVNKKELSGDGNTELATAFDAYWKDKVKPIFQKETQAAKSFIDKFSKETAKNFVKFTPYAKNKPREFTFVQESNPGDVEKNAIKDLGKKVNVNTSNDTWNDKVKFN
jgi:hypothetical protein